MSPFLRAVGIGIIAAMIGGAGAFEYCARQSARTLQAQVAADGLTAESNQVLRIQVQDEEKQIADQEAQIRELRLARDEQHAIDLAAITRVQAAAGTLDGQRRLLAQTAVADLVQLNACKAAARQLQAQQTAGATGSPQTQQIVAALLKAILR